MYCWMCVWHWCTFVVIETSPSAWTRWKQSLKFWITCNYDRILNYNIMFHCERGEEEEEEEVTRYCRD